ncbi:MAG: metallophosphoesterase, partial [Candidatus Paceibacterota bacterium]
MLKPLKIRLPAEKVWLTADNHFRHNRPWIIEVRGFKTIEEHDETLISRWNETVSDDGVVLMLGDFCLMSTETDFW